MNKSMRLIEAQNLVYSLKVVIRPEIDDIALKDMKQTVQKLRQLRELLEGNEEGVAHDHTN